MLQRLLVPIDGSEVSERALPYVALLAAAQGARVTVVQVLDLLQWARYTDEGFTDPQQYDDLLGVIRSEAQDSLERARGVLDGAGVTTEVELLEGTGVGGALLDYEAELLPDLVVMATHGRTGVTRFTLGSVAERMVREGTVPVLLVPAFGEAVIRLTKGLVPLDGSALAERALTMVEALAHAPLTDVELLTVVGSKARLAHPEGAQVAASSPAEYLAKVAARLQANGLATTTNVVQEDDPADAIAEAAGGADLVIMSTHGRTGWDRLRHGSVAERATRQLSGPRLLVRAQSAHAAETR